MNKALGRSADTNTSGGSRFALAASAGVYFRKGAFVMHKIGKPEATGQCRLSVIPGTDLAPVRGASRLRPMVRGRLNVAKYWGARTKTASTLRNLRLATPCASPRIIFSPEPEMRRVPSCWPDNLLAERQELTTRENVAAHHQLL